MRVRLSTELINSNIKVYKMSEAALSSGNHHHHSHNCGYGSGAQISGQKADQLFREYGVQNVMDAVTNAAVEFVQKELNALIDSLGMPQFMKDDAKAQVACIGNDYRSDAPGGAQCGVNDVLSKGYSGGSSCGSNAGGSDSADALMSGVMDMLRQSMQEETEGATKSGSGGGRGNWLAILARALGSTAGKHLKKMVELGEKMGSIDSKESPEQFAQIQAEFQAEAQIFKMFQEAIGTMIKSIGEGLSSVARKQ